MILVVAILETMWGAPEPGQEAQRYFKINPANHSGRRLYRLIGPDAKLLVTNACREYVTSATQHGKPDPAWLRENLEAIDREEGRIDVLLVCGKVAQQTYGKAGWQPARAVVIEMPHPAARSGWTVGLLANVAERIRSARGESGK